MKLLYLIFILFLVGCSDNYDSQATGPVEECHKGKIPANTNYKLLGDKLVDIFVLIGQSNMSGRDIVTMQNYNSNIFLFGNGYKWAIAKEPTDSPVNQVDCGTRDIRAGQSAGIPFASKLTNYYDNIALVQCSHGGRYIKEFSPLINGGVYDICLEKIKIAQKNGTIRGILFWQGEADSKGITIAATNTWLSEFKLLISSLRYDIGEIVPVIAAVISSQIVNPEVNIVRSQQEMIPYSLEKSSIIYIDDIEMADKYHHFSDGYIIAGERFADEYKEKFLN